MSWYFLGGFSAYAMVPSIRVVNHSGCVVTQGWSGEACRAKSSAISIPSSRARATRRSNESQSPRSGWMASCPPAALPMAHGEPGSSADGSSELFLPFLNALPIGWIGGK